MDRNRFSNVCKQYVINTIKVQCYFYEKSLDPKNLKLTNLNSFTLKI